jgi:hypothetical protein
MQRKKYQFLLSTVLIVGFGGAAHAQDGKPVPSRPLPPLIPTVAPTLSVPTDPAVSTRVRTQIAALIADKKVRTRTQRKISSQLLYATRQWNGRAAASGVTDHLHTGANLDMAGRALVDIRVTRVTSELLNAIAATGGEVIGSYPRTGGVRARLGIGWLETIAARRDVRVIRPADMAINNIGKFTSEGDTTHNAGIARKVLGATGAGLTVGVISDSNDFQEDSQASLDLPEEILVLEGQDGRIGSGEGTAMMEIVHDLAPDAAIQFASAFNGADSFAQNIRDLRAAGSDIIVDDVTYFLDDTPFQDGIIAQAVNDVVADGALYFSSAGNSGNVRYGSATAWEGDYTDGGDSFGPIEGGGRLHRFAPGRRGAGLFNTTSYSIGYLFWSDPLGQSTNDYDLYCVSRDGNTLIAASTDIQDGAQDPVEFVNTLFDGFIAFNTRFYVTNYNDAEPRAFHFNPIFAPGQYTTGGNTRGHNAAENAFSVAAASIYTSFPNPFLGAPYNTVEGFSADGPRRIFYEPDGTPITPGNFLFRTNGGRALTKPDITAADGVITNTPGFQPFYGTSAAAPHAAAITAQILSFNPFLTQGEVRQLLQNTAYDIEVPGIDTVTGHGLIMSYNAIKALIDFILPQSVRVVNVTATSATIQFKTALDADGTVTCYDPDGNVISASDSVVAPEHTITVTGLSPETVYTFFVDSATPSGSAYGAQEGTFKTLPEAEATLLVADATLTRDAQGRLLATVTIENQNSGTASNVRITGATLGAAGTQTPLPAVVPNILAGTSQTGQVVFAPQRPGTRPILRVTGTFINTVTGRPGRFSGQVQVTVPGTRGD